MKYRPIIVGVDTSDIEARIDAQEIVDLKDAIFCNKRALLTPNGAFILNEDGAEVVLTPALRGQIVAEIATMEARIAELL